MRKKRIGRGSTLIELMVAMSIFLVVSGAVVVLMRHAQVVSIWGEKKNDALRQNREIMRRIGLHVRQAVPRPAFNTTVASPPIISVTTVSRNQDPSQPPFPPGHLEQIDFWCSTEEARRSIGSQAYPVPTYPAVMSYNPRTAEEDVPNNFSRLRLEWSQDTGELSLHLMSNDGLAILATKKLVSTAVDSNGRRTSALRCVDFRQDTTTASVGVYLETRSRDRNSKFAERRYSSDTQFNLPAWQ